MSVTTVKPYSNDYVCEVKWTVNIKELWRTSICSQCLTDEPHFHFPYAEHIFLNVYTDKQSLYLAEYKRRHMYDTTNYISTLNYKAQKIKQISIKEENWIENDIYICI